MIRAIVVDDVSTVRMALKQILQLEGDIQVVGEGRTGRDAVSLTQRLRPDIVLMDVDMPHMDGLEATKEIMAKSATPILIVTASSVYDARGMPFTAIEAGALDVFPKPSLFGSESWTAVGLKLRRAVRTLSQVKVISRRRRPVAARVPARPEPQRKSKPAAEPQAPAAREPKVKASAGNYPDMIAIGASTGGPMVVRQILAALPADYSIPIVVVQHIGDEFVHGLVDWLDKNTEVEVRLARDRASLEPGIVSVAPGGVHIKITESLMVRYDDGPMLHHCKPAVDVLFHSVAKNVAPRAAGILLTGMGRDGADGLKALRNTGCMTVAQDEQTSTVYGMPAAAVDLGAAQQVLPPLRIGQWLLRVAQERPETQ